MSMIGGWESIFHEAVHEADPTMAALKIRMAELAICDRMNDFSASGSLEEQALFDALGTIRDLKSVRRAA